MYLTLFIIEEYIRINLMLIDVQRNITYLTNLTQNRFIVIIIMIMIMIIFIHKNDASQILADNKQQSPNLTPPVERYHKLISLIIN